MELVKINYQHLIKEYKSGKSLRQLAVQYDTSKQTIKKKLIKFGIEITSSRDFVNNNKEQHQINSSPIRKSHRITARDVSTRLVELFDKQRPWATYDNLYDLYIMNCFSIEKIATQYKSDPITIRKLLIRFGIIVRSLQQANNLYANSADGKSKRSILSKKLWKDPKYKEKIRSKLIGRKMVFSDKEKWLTNLRNDISNKWNDKSYRDSIIEKLKTIPKSKLLSMSRLFWSSPDLIDKWKETRQQNDLQLKASVYSYALWQDKEYQRKQEEARIIISNKAKETWKNPEYRNKILRSRQFTSSLEVAILGILADLKIDAKKMFIGGFEFDIGIEPKNEMMGLLIEVQGTRFHQNNENDFKKNEYWKNNLSSIYKFIKVDEYEFGARNKVNQRLCDALMDVGYIIPHYDINFNELIFRKIELTQALAFYKKYHYLTSPRFGLHYGLFSNDILVGSATISGITRLESAKRFNLKHTQIMELSRLCLNPFYNKKNLASYFIGMTFKSLKQERPNLKKVITFADKTVGHTGNVYLASGFKRDGETAPSFYYEIGGYYWHKRSMWTTAKNLGLTESELVMIMGLNKVDTLPKIRFVRDI